MREINRKDFISIADLSFTTFYTHNPIYLGIGEEMIMVSFPRDDGDHAMLMKRLSNIVYETEEVRLITHENRK